jgi:DNA segregation ATPase FtsK/SpoIIIE-like protein
MGGTLIKPQVFERADRIYIVAPVSPFTPGDADIEKFAFAEELKKGAPNPNLLWLRGNYVEADNANTNGDEWTAEELSIKSLTPMYCPVTVMHDPTTAVGVIADTSLLTPNADQVPRARIETSLAIWAHRFKDIAEEIAHNYEQGMLMQSMECQAPYYSCKACGQTFQTLPNRAERANWCEHLAGSPDAGRILGGVTFTGTGLIFGSRGAKGAYSDANLEVFHEEVVAAHQEIHRDSNGTKTTAKRRKTRMDGIEVPREEYAALQKRPTPEEFAAEKKRADDAEAAKAEADKAVEAAEAAQKKAEEKAEAEEKKVKDFEEKEAQSTMASDRLTKLGKGFMAAMGEKTTERFKADAAKMSDEDFEERVAELEETLDKKRDDGTTPSGSESTASEETFSTEEITASHTGSGTSGTPSGEPTDEARSAVIGGLLGNLSGDK